VSFRKSILLADLCSAPIPALAGFLEPLGYILFHSQNLLETKQAIHDKNPDLVVLRPSKEPMPRDEFQTIADALRMNQHLVISLQNAPRGEAMRDLCSRANDYSCGQSAQELAFRIDALVQRMSNRTNESAELRQLREESITDFKTDLFNDRYVVSRLQEEFDRATRYGDILSLIMLDFDTFKRINDTLGHAFGDFVLLSFAKKLKSLIRNCDIPGRLGGDEFLVILPKTDEAETNRIARRIQAIVNALTYEKEGYSVQLTISLGLNSYRGDGSMTWEEFLKGADLGLLSAKTKGKNAIVSFRELQSNDQRIHLPPSLKRSQGGAGQASTSSGGS